MNEGANTVRRIEMIEMEIPYCDRCGEPCLNNCWPIGGVDLCYDCYGECEAFTVHREHRAKVGSSRRREPARLNRHLNAADYAAFDAAFPRTASFT